jgi:hypothetical protein
MRFALSPNRVGRLAPGFDPLQPSVTGSCRVVQLECDQGSDHRCIRLIALTTTIDAVGAPVTETAGRVTAVTHRANTW